eukprot:4640081-Heterocapsa_arctica.AAC.1
MKVYLNAAMREMKFELNNKESNSFLSKKPMGDARHMSISRTAAIIRTAGSEESAFSELRKQHFQNCGVGVFSIAESACSELRSRHSQNCLETSLIINPDGAGACLLACLLVLDPESAGACLLACLLALDPDGAGACLLACLR